MKLLLVSSTILLWIDIVSSIFLLQQNPPAGQGNLSGPAHEDNFQEEIVDQADPEFDMASFGDNCINLTDAEQPVREAWQEGAPARDNLGESEADSDTSKEEMLADLKIRFNHADSNHDGCIDETEFKAAGEMEGPPPGYQKEKIDEMGEEEFEQKMKEEEKFEFDAMDRNGDGKISVPEAYHYTDENLPNADMSSQELQHLFKDCDLNRDKFLDFDEFTGCGPNHKGDGNEMEDAEPMALKIFKLNKKHLLARVKAKEAVNLKSYTRLLLITSFLRVRIPRRFK